MLDGRGQPPDEDDPKRPGLLFRLSVPGGDSEGGTGAGALEGNPVPDYGGQLQDRGIPGVAAEGSMKITYEEIEGTYADGTPYSLLSPTYSIEDPAYGPLPDDLLISPRIAPPTIGMGLLEAVPAEQVVARADAEDSDGDGISGRPNTVLDPVTGEEALGRFGWKANVASVRPADRGCLPRRHRHHLDDLPEAGLHRGAAGVPDRHRGRAARDRRPDARRRRLLHAGGGRPEAAGCEPTAPTCRARSCSATWAAPRATPPR